MPSRETWRRVASQHPRDFSSRAGHAKQAFADVFGLMQPGDMDFMSLPASPRERAAKLGTLLEQTRRQLVTMKSSYARLHEQGPWAMRRDDLFKTAAGPLRAYSLALEHHYRRLEHLVIKANRLRAYLDETESRALRQHHKEGGR
ncbi:hypothetical protein [Halomonas sp. I5-271120]|uniref:hypothetical protein n=1 Tax=Halomonas sp. I5-271120 TaxID=3061632 RepID=UPI0027154DC4|nr:hypothetical protein [Halomonas sp. I5-271120]